MTNGDKIRQMSDEELSEWLTNYYIEGLVLFLEENETPKIKINLGMDDEDVESFCRATLEWLSEEVQEDG